MPSPSPTPDIPIPNLSVWDFLFERPNRAFPGGKVIYRDAETNRTYTFDQVKDYSIAFGQTLKSKWNWQVGDCVATYSPNTIDFPLIVWGTHWAGGVLSPANPAYTAKELAFQLKDSKAKVLVTQLDNLDVAIQAAKDVGIPMSNVLLIGDQRDESNLAVHFRDLRADGKLKSMDRKSVAINPKKDLAFLAYSSGTTGLPKGVMISNYNVVANLLMMDAHDPGNNTWDGGPGADGDRMLGFLPFYHAYGLVVLMHSTMFVGSELLVIPRFDLEKVCSYIEKFKVTLAPVVPPVLLLLAKHPIVAKYDLSSLRMLSCGAAPLTKELVDAVHNRLKVPIRQGYGLSETSPAATGQKWDTWNKTTGSVGQLLPNMIAKHVSPDGKELPIGEVGELWLKGPNIFLGYLNNPEGTKNSFSPDGYFKTGDIGYQDKDGHFYITDRMKELIKYKGFQVAPAELEGLLISHPDIDDTAVIGVMDHSQATEVPRAYVVLKPGVQATKDQEARIAKWLSERVGSHKRLRGGVRFINQIPKSAAGKILRRVLAEEVKKEEQRLKSKL